MKKKAQPNKIKKSPVKLIAFIAVGLAALAVALLICTRPTKTKGSGSENPASGSDDGTLRFNKSSGQTAERIIIEGHFWEDLTAEQVKKLLPNIAQKYDVTGIVNYSSANEKISIFDVNTSFKVNENEASICISRGEIAKDYIIEGEALISEIEGVKIEAGIYSADKKSTGEQIYVYYANFKIADVAYYAEYVGEEKDKELFAGIITDIVLGGKADLSIVENPTVPELRDDILSEQEAYAESDFGAYLPAIPNTYLFNSASRFVNQSSDYLFASWSHGYENVRFSISKLKEQDKERIVKPEDAALYDMALYPVPWTDSMPKDKAYIIENPIFKIEDLTQDIVKMRGYTRADKGETSANSVNMRFSVLYEGILVEVAAEGLTPDYLFDALSALPRK